MSRPRGVRKMASTRTRTKTPMIIQAALFRRMSLTFLMIDGVSERAASELPETGERHSGGRHTGCHSRRR